MLRAFGALLIGGALLVGCAPDSGTVLNKNYDDPDTRTVSKQSCTGTGTAKKCTTKYETVRDPERYELQLRNGDDVGWRTVSSSEFNRYQVGQQYP